MLIIIYECNCRDLGAHVDGFIAVVAHTITVGLTPGNKLTGRHADVVLAAHQASQAALRLLKPGNEVMMHVMIKSILILQVLSPICF